MVSTGSLCFPCPTPWWISGDFENFSFFQRWKRSTRCQLINWWSFGPLTTVSVKLPIFWTDSPSVWFLQAEAQFEDNKITFSRTNISHCIATLPQDVACRLLDLVKGPPPGGPYKALRRRLIQMYWMSDFQRHHQALHSLSLLSSELMDIMLIVLP